MPNIHTQTIKIHRTKTLSEWWECNYPILKDLVSCSSKAHLELFNDCLHDYYLLHWNDRSLLRKSTDTLISELRQFLLKTTYPNNFETLGRNGNVWHKNDFHWAYEDNGEHDVQELPILNYNMFKADPEQTCVLGYQAESGGDVQSVNSIPGLENIPVRERELLNAIYVEHTPQTVLARRLHMTQGNISHMLRVTKKRLKYLQHINNLSTGEEIEDMIMENLRGKDRDIIRIYLKTTGQTQTAEMLNKKYRSRNWTQSSVRHALRRILIQLKPSPLRRVLVYAFGHPYSLNVVVCNNKRHYNKSAKFKVHEA